MLPLLNFYHIWSSFSNCECICLPGQLKNAKISQYFIFRCKAFIFYIEKGSVKCCQTSASLFSAHLYPFLWYLYLISDSLIIFVGFTLWAVGQQVCGHHQGRGLPRSHWQNQLQRKELQTIRGTYSMYRLRKKDRKKNIYKLDLPENSLKSDFQEIMLF